MLGLAQRGEDTKASTASRNVGPPASALSIWGPPWPPPVPDNVLESRSASAANALVDL